MRFATQLAKIPAVQLLRWLMLRSANIDEEILRLHQHLVFLLPRMSIFPEALLLLSLSP